MKPVLIVDDEHDILSFLKWELKQSKIQSDQVDNPEDAIKLLKENEYLCVLTDIVLKNISSEKIVNFIKSEENLINKELPIIVMSGKINDEFIERNKSKFYKIVEKPFSQGEIIKILNELI